MKVVPGASCAAVPSVPARAGPREPRATRARKPLNLSSWEHERLNNKIYRVVCSYTWYRHCKGLITSGVVAYKDDQAKELRRAGVYPPGGYLTGMEKCTCCGHWCPPGRYAHTRHVEQLDDGQVRVTYSDCWRPVCDDCRYGDMHAFDQVRVTSAKPIDRPVRDADFPAHLEASGWQRRSKRRRYLGDAGLLQEEIRTEDGEVYDVIVMSPAAMEQREVADAAAADAPVDPPDDGSFAGNEA